MTWEEKFAAIMSLCGIGDVAVKMRAPGDWYVQWPGEITSDESGVLEGRYGNGIDPCEAIKNHWQRCVLDLEPSQYIVIDAYKPTRKHYRWNGYMWLELPRKETVSA